MATAVLTAIALVPDVAVAQRNGRGGDRGGDRGGAAGGATVRSAPARRTVPRSARPVYRGNAYRGSYRTVYVGRPPYWGGLGLGWGYSGLGYGGWGAWGPGWWGPGYASSMWWPGYGWWGGPAMYAPPYGAYRVTSNARFLVSPRAAEVYIDGALAGIADQYDGVFQSLALAPGTHQVSLYLDGHRRHDANVYVAPGSTLKFRHTMEPLPSGAAPDQRPTPPPLSQGVGPNEQGPSGEPTMLPAMPESRSRHEPRETREVAAEAGVLVIRIQPVDAEVLIDGQRWQTPDPTQPLEVRVPAGRVRVEVHKPGFAPFRTEVTVQPGQVTPVNVSLPLRGQQP